MAFQRNDLSCLFTVFPYIIYMYVHMMNIILYSSPTRDLYIAVADAVFVLVVMYTHATDCWDVQT